MPLFTKGNILNILRRSVQLLLFKKLSIFRRTNQKFKKRKHLLINEEIPIKYSPQKPRNVSTTDAIQYVSSKRSHPDSETPENRQPSLKVRKREPISRPKIVKTINFNVDVEGDLGLTIERDQDSVKAKYVISKINSNSQTIDRQRLWLGDEVVKISKQQIRGTSENQLKQIIDNCLGKVEFTVSRDPNFSFEGNLMGDWAKHLIPRTKDDSQIWKLLDPSENVADGDQIETASRDFENTEKSCEIVEYSRKNQRREVIEKMEKETGMKKFFLKKTPVNLPQDLIVVQLESASIKQLGFSIVGGSDCKIGNLGIFVKNISPESQAAEEGKLKTGDEIWTVNEIIVKGKTHANALQIIQAAKNQSMTLKIRRGFTKVKF